MNQAEVKAILERACLRLSVSYKGAYTTLVSDIQAAIR